MADWADVEKAEFRGFINILPETKTYKLDILRRTRTWSVDGQPLAIDSREGYKIIREWRNAVAAHHGHDTP